jgi:glutaredoxin
VAALWCGRVVWSARVVSPMLIVRIVGLISRSGAEVAQPSARRLELGANDATLVQPAIPYGPEHDGKDMMRLYQLEWCPECHTVRQVVTELGLSCDLVNVAADREQRPDVVTASSQSGVPVLEDGTDVFVGAHDILEHVRATYPLPADAGEHARRGAWRASRKVALEPRAALARLKDVLRDKELTVVAEVHGPAIAGSLPEDYVQLYVALPAAAARAFEADPLSPAALLVPIAVVPSDGGSTIAATDAVGQVWLYGDAPLRRIQQTLKARLNEVLSEL